MYHHSGTSRFASMTKEPPLSSHAGCTLSERGTVWAREIGVLSEWSEIEMLRLGLWRRSRSRRTGLPSSSKDVGLTERMTTSEAFTHCPASRLLFDSAILAQSASGMP